MRILPVPPEGFQWIVSRTGCAPTAHFQAIAAVDDSGRICGMVGFDSWTPNAVQLHWAADEPIALRKLIPAAFDFAFNQAGRSMAFGVIPADNAKSIGAAKRAGLVEAWRVPDGWSDGVDLVFLQLKKQDCRYLSDTKKAA